MDAPRPMPRRRWRHYATPSGRRPTREFVDALDDEERAATVAAMGEVAVRGLRAARHLRGEIYEVRAEGDRAIRLLFAAEGRSSRVLLALHAFAKQTQATPPREIELARRRLADWRSRGATAPRT